MIPPWVFTSAPSKTPGRVLYMLQTEREYLWCTAGPDAKLAAMARLLKEAGL